MFKLLINKELIIPEFSLLRSRFWASRNVFEGALRDTQKRLQKRLIRIRHHLIPAENKQGIFPVLLVFMTQVAPYLIVRKYFRPNRISSSCDDTLVRELHVSPARKVALF